MAGTAETADNTDFAAHAEGNLTTASAIFSHAEGKSTTASGTAAHAEGFYTLASGYASHAEGYYTNTNNSYAHAEGNYTVASGGQFPRRRILYENARKRIRHDGSLADTTSEALA